VSPEANRSFPLSSAEQIPGWALFACALGLFVYQTLDACDGKQARRTNTSSQLGELFDHGCDAISTGKWTTPR
jgi:phosphatidylglycerophosphate synthase